jgi:multiple antibiotic resistance protein
MNWDVAIKEFISIWVVVDPIGTIPVFFAVTAGLSAAQQRAIAVKCTTIASLVLLFFIVVGQVLLEALNISLEAFQLAGGIVLFMFATTMIFGEGKPASEQKNLEGDISQLAVFPLAVPSLASPGAMLDVVMLTNNDRFSIMEQVGTAGIMLAVMLCALILLLFANPLQRLLGNAGASIISRVMGLILASVAVDNILQAITAYFHLGPVGA